VLIQVIMVSLILAFPQIISIAKKTDMKEKLELKLDMPKSKYDADGPELNFSTDSNGESSGEPQLNFSTEPDKK
jgi:hypothetical protein